MPTEYLKETPIGELLNSPAGQMLRQAAEKIAFAQRNLFALLNSEDSNQLNLLKIGTVFQIFLIDTLATGKKPQEMTEQDWQSIADKVSKYAILEDGQCYSEFVFTLYARYIKISAKSLKTVVPKENANAINAIADEILELTTLLQQEEITEVDYVDKCLWLSLEAMIKCLSLSLTFVGGQELTQLAEATAQLAFEYGRNVLFAKEQALLQEYIKNQYELDEKLRAEYEAYIAEVNENAQRFQSLLDAAFSPSLHESLQESIALARAAGVKEEDLLTSIEDIDDFFS